MFSAPGGETVNMTTFYSGSKYLVSAYYYSEDVTWGTANPSLNIYSDSDLVRTITYNPANKDDIETSGTSADYRSWAIACIDNDLNITELNTLYTSS